MGGKYKVAVIEGDGVGPEIVREAIRLLNEVGFNAEYIKINAGLKYYEETGKTIEDGALDIIRKTHALIKGPIATPLGPGTYRSVNVWLRKQLGLYANVRPFRSYRGISLKELDIVVIRENTEGAYSGVEEKIPEGAVTYRIITREATEKIVRFAFEYARKYGRKKVTVVHKANILKESDGLFRNIFFEIAREYPNIESDEVIVDAAAYKLVKRPHLFDVMVTPNLYGDILSDLVAGVVGGLGLCGSAQIGDNYAAFEPVHGTAVTVAGKGIANPIGEIKAASLMLKWLSERHGDGKLRRIHEA
ncbi:MAG: isocitrate/isopropylmalate dehydrogenase family protein, partial [Thermoprotei archaeon]|nr:isocitrate/isopropylmalate dehydrogenase family protein [Thermoprotei archaeon]